MSDLALTSHQAEQRGAVEPPAPSPQGFASLGLHDALLRAVQAQGYQEPTPIQLRAIPPALARRDVLGCARTGTGKTAAFVLPMLQHLMGTASARGQGHAVRALVLAPTRELSAQIADSITAYGRGTSLRHVTIFGGVSQQRQVQALRSGVEIVVATPGRLVDLIDQGIARLGGVEVLVLDEFDRMLDQGFLPAIRRVLRELPTERQTLLFSATMPPEIESVVQRLVRDPVRITVSTTASTPESIDQAVWFVGHTQKRGALEHILRDPGVTRAVVFTRTKHGANRVTKQLQSAGIDADVIHGNKSQSARERAMRRYRDGSLHVLVATDIAARGIDIDDISHVINFDLPVDPESYVHRIGRTARAGRAGLALSLCTPEERPTLVRIERLIGRALRPMNEVPPPSASGPDAREPERGPAPRSGQRRRGGAGPQRNAAPRVDARAEPQQGSTPRPAKRLGSWAPRTSRLRTAN